MDLDVVSKLLNNSVSHLWPESWGCWVNAKRKLLWLPFLISLNLKHIVRKKAFELRTELHQTAAAEDGCPLWFLTMPQHAQTGKGKHHGHQVTSSHPVSCDGHVFSACLPPVLFLCLGGDPNVGSGGCLWGFRQAWLMMWTLYKVSFFTPGFSGGFGVWSAGNRFGESNNLFIVFNLVHSPMGVSIMFYLTLSARKWYLTTFTFTPLPLSHTHTHFKTCTVCVIISFFSGWDRRLWWSSVFFSLFCLQIMWTLLNLVSKVDYKTHSYIFICM